MAMFNADYIDTVFGPSLWPADPYKKAVDQILVEEFGSKVGKLAVGQCIVPCL